MAPKGARDTIVRAFSEWTAYSATRAGWPRSVKKNRKTVYPLIRTPNYDAILSPQGVSRGTFDHWHKESTDAICRKAPGLPTGWAVKLINVYLKTRVYLARDGSSRLADCLHPPIDNGLWNGIKAVYRNTPEIMQKTRVVNRIKDITDYPTYMTIIEGCREIAKRQKCRLIEVEELWQGTSI